MDMGSNPQTRRRSVTISWLILALILGGCATGGPREAASPRSPGSALVQSMAFAPLHLAVPRVGTDVQRRVLPNGIVLYLATDRSLPVVKAHALFRAGNLYEDPARPGAAQFTASQLRAGGTETMPAAVLNEELEVLGISVESGVSSEAMSLSLSALSKDADRAFQLYADILQRPTFAPAPLETHRGRVVDDLRRVPDTPARLMMQEFARIMYTDAHPLGRPLTPAQARALRRDDLLEHYRRFVRPDNMWLAVVGDSSVDELAAKVQAHLGEWRPAGRLSLPGLPAVEPRFEHGVYLLPRALTQSNVVLGHFGIDRSNPDRYAVQLMDMILGGSGFTSRIMERVRTEEGLAYSVSSSFPTSNREVGLFRVTVQTKNESVPRAVRVILDEMERMRTAPVTPAELENAKEALINSFVFRFASRFSVVTQLLALEFDEYPPDYLDTLLDRYRAVSRDDVQRVARRYLRPEAATILVLGDAALFESDLAALPFPPPIERTAMIRPVADGIVRPTAQTNRAAGGVCFRLDNLNRRAYPSNRL
jgi:predicted Zn-dependent peptidase